MRLIDADALAMHLANWQLSCDREEYDIIEEAIRTIDEAPTIDAVPVVRCRECFVYDTCQAAKFYGDDGYCSVGERKDDE